MGDERDFDEFYAASYRRVVSQIYAMTGNLAESEDSVQGAFAKAWRRWNSISQYGNPEAWVRTVAFRASVSAWRKAASRLVAHRQHGAVHEVPGLSPDRLALITALRRISADQRRVIVLHYLVGHSVEEISVETGMPVGTVKSHLARGRKALAPHVSEFGPEESAGQMTPRAQPLHSAGKEITSV